MKYNILFMRDDKPVRRFRMNPSWLKSLLIFFLLVAVLASITSYTSYTLWTENKELKKKLTQVEQTLTHNQAKLQRLENMELLLQQENASTPLPTLHAVSKANEEKKAETDFPGTNLQKLFNHVSTGQIGLNNVQARIKDKVLKLAFDINNLTSDHVLSGDISLELIDTWGKVVDVTDSIRDHTFEIQKFKSVNYVLQLPESIAEQELFAFRLTLKNQENDIIYLRETFVLSHILV